jgi:hypothetical protein
MLIYILDVLASSNRTVNVKRITNIRKQKYEQEKCHRALKPIEPPEAGFKTLAVDFWSCPVVESLHGRRADEHAETAATASSGRDSLQRPRQVF